MVKTIHAKTILAHVKQGPGNIFGTKYNMNLYRGCQHGCIYCDSRSKCYGIENFSEILVKENALALLEKELKAKRVKGAIGFGSMNDPYMPVEKDLELTRNALKLINKYRFPVHIITKSNLVVRDIDLLMETARIYAAITITITTVNDALSKQLEPGAPASSERFNAIKQLTDAGIYTGITLMPVLPFLTDTKDNIENLIVKAKESGAKYILASMGMTLRDIQRDYYYNKLDIHFPELKKKYSETYKEQYGCPVPNASELWKFFTQCCKKLSMPVRMEFYEPKEPKQLSLF